MSAMLHHFSVMDKAACPMCGMHRSPIAYARAMELRMHKPEYHTLSQATMLLAYQQEQLSLFEQLMTYDRLCDWARTTRRGLFGLAGRVESHPLRYYLDDVYPGLDRWRAQWKIFSSACDALKGMKHIPHTRGIPFFPNAVVEETGVRLTMFCPLPTWTRRVMDQFQALPFGAKVTREHFLTMLRASR